MVAGYSQMLSFLKLCLGQTMRCNLNLNLNVGVNGTTQQDAGSAAPVVGAPDTVPTQPDGLSSGPGDEHEGTSTDSEEHSVSGSAESGEDGDEQQYPPLTEEQRAPPRTQLTGLDPAVLLRGIDRWDGMLQGGAAGIRTVENVCA
jgi:hypothetical protein